MEIFLIRHTEVDLKQNICYGQINVPLQLNSFDKTARTIKNKLPTAVDTLFSSPLERCKLLAEHLNLGPINYDDSLKEMNFGDWEGMEWNKITPNELNPWMQDFVNINPPNGENLLALYARVEGVIETLREVKNTNKVAVITHAGVIRCFYAYFLELPLKNLFKISIQYGEVHLFKLSKNKNADMVIGKV